MWKNSKKQPRRVYNTIKERALEFAIGFIGWYVLNGLYLLGVSKLGEWLFPTFPLFGDIGTVLSYIIYFTLLCLFPLLNVLAWAYFFQTSYWISYGIVAAWLFQITPVGRFLQDIIM